MKRYRAAVVGGGIAGYTAALALKNLKVDCVWFGEKGFGEKLRLAEGVRNFPSFSGRGEELASLLEAQREREGVTLTEARIDGVYAQSGGYILTAGKDSFFAEAVVLCTGVETAGAIKGEREFLGRGVSYCAVCDGALYRGKKIAAVLSSEKYAEEVEYLSGFAEEVHAFYRGTMSAFRASNIILHTEKPEEISGSLRVEKIVAGGREIPVSGVFFLRDSVPPAALVGGLKTADGHVAVGRDCSTNLKGLFAAGDVTGRPYQYVKAAGEGLVAAYAAADYLRTSGKAE